LSYFVEEEKEEVIEQQHEKDSKVPIKPISDMGQLPSLIATNELCTTNKQI
jgi:hypothetical protein